MKAVSIKKIRVDENKCSKCNMCNIVLPGFFTMYCGHLYLSEEQFKNEKIQERIKTMVGICLEQAFIIEDAQVIETEGTGEKTG